MVHITEQTPTHYTQRHPDWYNGNASAICHAMGLLAAKEFYLRSESEAAAIDALFPMDSWINPLTWIETFLINVKKTHYANNYLTAYDNSALQGCKFFEKIDPQFAKVVQDLNAKAQQVIAQIESTYINPLRTKINNEIAPMLNSVNSKVASFQNSLASLQNMTTQAQNTASNAQSYATTAYNNATNAVNRANQVTEQLNESVARINQVNSEIEAAKARIEQLVRDAQAKTEAIEGNIKPRLSDLENKVKSLNYSQNTTTPAPSGSVREQFQNIFK